MATEPKHRQPRQTEGEDGGQRRSAAAYRAALRRGLQILESGKRRYVTGEEILRFLKADSSRRSI